MWSIRSFIHKRVCRRFLMVGCSFTRFPENTRQPGPQSRSHRTGLQAARPPWGPVRTHVGLDKAKPVPRPIWGRPEFPTSRPLKTREKTSGIPRNRAKRSTRCKDYTVETRGLHGYESIRQAITTAAGNDNERLFKARSRP